MVGENGGRKENADKTAIGPADFFFFLLIDRWSHRESAGDGPVPTATRCVPRSVLCYFPYVSREHEPATEVSAAEFAPHLARVSGCTATRTEKGHRRRCATGGLYEERYRRDRWICDRDETKGQAPRRPWVRPVQLVLWRNHQRAGPTGRAAMLEWWRASNDFGISVVVCTNLLGEIETDMQSLVAIEAPECCVRIPAG